MPDFRRLAARVFLAFSLLMTSTETRAATGDALVSAPSERAQLVARKKKVRTKKKEATPPSSTATENEPSETGGAAEEEVDEAPPAPAVQTRAQAAPVSVAQTTTAETKRDPAVMQLGAMLGILRPVADASALRAWKVRGEAFMRYGEVTPRVTLMVGGNLGLSRGSDEQSMPTYLSSSSSFRVSSSTTTLDVLGVARALYAAHDKVSLWAEGGVGVMYIRFGGQVDTIPNDPLLERSLSDSTWAPELRAAGGISFAPAPRMRLTVELVGLSFLVNTERAGVGALYSFMLGGSYAL